MKTNFSLTKILRCYVAVQVILGWISCDSATTTASHDPGQAVKIDRVTPDIAGVAEDIFIYGSNFSTNIQDIQVTINNKPATVIGSTLDLIYAVVPKRPDTEGVITVKIGEQISNELNFQYRTAEVSKTFAGTGVAGDAIGPGEKAQFNFTDMGGMCLDAQGNLFVADCGNNKIKKISPNGEVKLLTASGLSKPMDVVCDKAGNVFVANCDGSSILRIGVDNKIVQVTAMSYPTALAYDEETDQLYAVLYAGGDIMRIKNKDVEISTNDNIEFFLNTSTINVSYMKFYKGNLYFTSATKDAIYVLRKGEAVAQVIAGVEGAEGRITEATNALQAQLTNPCGLSFSENGSLYFSSGSTTRAASVDNRLMVLKPDGKVYPLIGKVTAGNADGGTSTAMFDSPSALVVTSSEDIYVLDKRNQRIRKITLE